VSHTTAITVSTITYSMMPAFDRPVASSMTFTPCVLRFVVEAGV
jgi:hypothetical protein